MPKLRRKSALKRKDESKLLMREARQKAETKRFSIRRVGNGGSNYSGVLLVSDGV